MGVSYSCLIALLPNARGRGPRGERGWPPPNQPHQLVPTGWGDGWMGMGATPGAEFNTRCQLIRSVPYLIQGVAPIFLPFADLK